MAHLYSLHDWADGDASIWQDSIFSEAAALEVHLIMFLEDKLR